MSFTGNLASVSFGDILQLISTGKKTGALLLIRGQQRKRIFFRDGQVVYAATEAVTEDRLGQLLVRHGKITPEQLKSVLKKQGLSKKRFGEIVIDMHLVSREELAESLRLQVEEIVYSTFAWGDGEFQFMEGETPPARSPSVEIDTMAVMMEGARRFDEWSRIRDALPPAETVLQIRSAPLMTGGEVCLSAEDVELLSLVDGRRRVDEIIESCNRGEYSAARSLYTLLDNGILEPSLQPAAEAIDQDEEANLYDLVFKLYSHSLSRIHNELSNVLGEGAGRLFSRPTHRKFVRGLSDSLTGGGTGSSRERFMQVADSIPKNLRLHKILNQSAALLGDRLMVVRQCLGDRAASRMAEAIKKDVAFLLAQKRDLADKYDVGREFTESLHVS